MRALAEAPQLLLNYSGIEYEYLMSWEHFEDIYHRGFRFFVFLLRYDTFPQKRALFDISKNI